MIRFLWMLSIHFALSLLLAFDGAAAALVGAKRDTNTAAVRKKEQHRYSHGMFSVKQMALFEEPSHTKRMQEATSATCSWTQIGSDINGENADDLFGSSVALSKDGTTLAVGAYLNDGNSVASGHVRVFKLSGSRWTQIGENIEGEARNDYFGISVSLSEDGTILAVGADGADGNNRNDSDSGHVRVFRFETDKGWIQIGDDIDGDNVDDEFGGSVSLSADGTVLAVGAEENGGNGDRSGRVRVFKFNSDTGWTQMGNAIDGEAARDFFGSSVFLSADGTVLAVGAEENNGNGNDSGHVRVFRF